VNDQAHEDLEKAIDEKQIAV